MDQAAPHRAGSFATGPAPLETLPAPLEARPRSAWKNWRLPRPRINLFWRTFFLLALLLIGSVVAWFQTFRVVETEPRAAQTAQQIASIVNLSKAALVHADDIARVSLIKQLSELEGVKVHPRKASDSVQPLTDNFGMPQIVQQLRKRLGDKLVYASQVNGQTGLWIGMSIDTQDYWLQTDIARAQPVPGTAWITWLSIASLLSLAGAAVIAGLINRPLKELSFAASRVRDGNFQASHLNEQAATSEIREVNAGFNRMAEQLSKVEQDRAVMLAGISHDLRTPLARLRLETEMSVHDEQAKEHMVQDLEQLDGIIDKFLDYARPADQHPWQRVQINDVIESCTLAAQHMGDLKVQLDLPQDFAVQGDEVELTRVVTNLLENARKYGKTMGKTYTEIDIAARERDGYVYVKIRDHGQGVAPEVLSHLTKPFFRGDVARTAATGAGLGLAIVEKTLQRMGGQFTLANSSKGGLSATLRLVSSGKAAFSRSGNSKGHGQYESSMRV
jgi:two-component system, OmpR family, osmolarity sensor histidine kinase EnvZ